MCGILFFKPLKNSCFPRSVGVIFAGVTFDIPRMGWVAVGRASKRNERAGPLLCETGYIILSYSSRTSFISPTLIPNGMPSPGGGGLAEYLVSRSESTVPGASAAR